MNQPVPPTEERPAPLLLVSVALSAGAHDAQHANRLLVEAGLDRQPLRVFVAMLELAGAIAGYYGGELAAYPAAGIEPTPLEALVLDCASAVLAHESDRFNGLITSSTDTLDVLSREAFVGALLAYAAEMLLGVYTGNTPDTPLS